MASISKRDASASRTNNILAESWSTISKKYDAVLVPRFQPWTQNALDILRETVNNDMKCSRDNMSALVLCCGPGQELLPIAKTLGPSSKVMGTDIAPGMIDVARERIESECSTDENQIYRGCITAEVGDATDPPPGPYNVIFSAFGLQQLPQPIQAVKSWINVMKPGGICVCIYWPPDPPKIKDDTGCPFELWSNIVKNRLGKQNKDEVWDENIEDAIASAGGEVLERKFIVHEICWDDPNHMFEVMSKAGPWHAMRLRRGNNFVDVLGDELKALFPPGESLCHNFTASVIVIRRSDKASNCSKI